MAEPKDETPDTARRQRTRERLMDAAHDLFAARGISAVSIEAISEAAGFSRGAFYSNFASKNELFFAMMRRESALRMESLQAAVNHNIQPGAGTAALESEFISQVVAEVFAALPDDQTWALIHREFELLALRDPEVAPEFLEVEELFRIELSEVLQTTAATLKLRFTIDELLAADVLMAQYQRALRQAILHGYSDVATRVRESILETIPTLLHELMEPA